MTESAVKSAANLLGNILVEEGKYLWGAKDKVNELRNELLWMQSFLREADTLQSQDETVQMWVNQIKDHVYEAEDIIEEFVINVASRRRTNGFLNSLKRYSCIIQELYHLHTAASSIDSLTQKISTLSPKLEKYGVKRYIGISSTDKYHETLTAQVQESLKYAHLEDKKIVGLERNAEEVIFALKDTKPGRGFHAIYGMGGLGKTTLATKVFRDNGIKQHFSGGQAFVYISKQFEARSVLQEVLKCLNSGSASSEDDLVVKLQNVLKEKKCLVVLDDVWTQQAWDVMKMAFTSCGGVSGSKVLVTTRKEEVAKYVDSTALQKPDPLDDEKSWELLQKTMGWETNESSRNKKDPQIVGNKEVGSNVGIKWNLMRHCGGHPFSTEMLLRLLQTKDDIDITEWATTLEKLADSKGSLDFSQIFAFCYNDLPLHLRYCLIHLASFPKDVEISTKKLYQMWIAAGFVGSKYTDDVQIEEESIAWSYLTDLVQRGMVTILKHGTDYRAKTCRLKLALRDVAMAKAREDHTLKVFDHYEDAITSASNPNLRAQQLVLYLDQISPSTTVSLDEQIRSLNLISSPTSLLIFPNVSDPLYKEEEWEWFIYICKNFQSLWVLDLESMWMTKGPLPKEIGNLGQLRYLSLRGTWVTQLPTSMESLWSLQTLDLRVVESIIIPDVLWKLRCLEHLYLPHQFTTGEDTTKLRLHGLNYLQTLANVQTDKVCLNDLLQLKQLLEISIRKIHAADEFDRILESLSKSVTVCLCSEIINNEKIILSRLKNMHKLKIKGRLSVRLHPIMFPTQLEELTLKHTKHKEDPIPVLESFRQLRSICLGNDSLGKSMTLSKHFPECTTLTLCLLVHLKDLYYPRRCRRQIVSIDCWRLNWHALPPWTEDPEKKQEPNISAGKLEVCGG